MIRRCINPPQYSCSYFRGGLTQCQIIILFFNLNYQWLLSAASTSTRYLKISPGNIPGIGPIQHLISARYDTWYWYLTICRFKILLFFFLLFYQILLLGKVYVSHIVDFLRHTTSRTSGDKGLEDLCNMLDPERRDVSIDLDTYHAVMREWIDDCRNNG